MHQIIFTPFQNAYNGAGEMDNFKDGIKQAFMSNDGKHDGVDDDDDCDDGDDLGGRLTS